jgi:hypothetical protein
MPTATHSGTAEVRFRLPTTPLVLVLLLLLLVVMVMVMVIDADEVAVVVAVVAVDVDVAVVVVAVAVVDVVTLMVLAAAADCAHLRDSMLRVDDSFSFALCRLLLFRCTLDRRALDWSHRQRLPVVGGRVRQSVVPRQRPARRRRKEHLLRVPSVVWGSRACTT